MQNRDRIEILEAAYDIGGTDQTWLERLAAASLPHLDRGRGVSAFFFDAHPQRPFRTWGFVGAGDGGDREFAQAAMSFSSFHEQPFLDHSFRSPTLHAYTSEALASAGLYERMLDGWANLSENVPFRDVLMTKHLDANAQGCALASPDPAPEAVSAGARQRWTRIAVHMGAGLRLRQALAARAAANSEEAVLEPDGRLLHADGQAREPDARDALRRAVQDIETARGPLRRRDADEALNLWQGLVDGQWSLIDRFESDGRRFFVAFRNPELPPADLALRPREKQVATLAALGRSQKLIAYELGLSEGAVARYLSDALAKLRLDSSVELGVLGAQLGIRWNETGTASVNTLMLADGGGIELAVAAGSETAWPDVLTVSEGEIASMALAGMSNEAIADTRHCSVSTIANHLAAVYRKLGISGRGELGRFARAGDSSV
jgi:DNA-binding NarL/FixJ family response regulator